MENNDTICRTCLRLREGLCDGEKELTACPSYNRMTNRDKYFRYATDEELADLFTEKHYDENYFACPIRTSRRCSEIDCKVCFLDWLKQEVSE